MTASRGVHFCGSIRLPNENDESEEEIFETISTTLPKRLLRLPDGEPGRRQTFCGWQSSVLLKTPWIVNEFLLQMKGLKKEDYPPGKLEDIQLDAVQYDGFAVKSYQTFTKLKEKNQLDRETRFQVCLPTPLNPITYHVKQEYRERVEQMYEKLLLEALNRIQAQIPNEDLAVQWDCPIEVLFLDGLKFPFQPHFDVSVASIVDRLERLAAGVGQDVQLGFHLCYGDFEHRHIMEPKDMAVMVKLANALLARIQRPINWIHMPVPIDRKDEAYYMPLKDLKLQEHPETELYLGLVHANDLAGTQERITVAQTVIPGLEFGVATECGLGRTPREEIASILQILKTVSTLVLSADVWSGQTNV